MLDKRLEKIAELVSGKGIAADVGTDHAYLAAELVISGKCSRVIASDVKEGPLASAAKTVERYGISDKVQLVLSDGLAEVPLDGVTDVIIAGMGGETISDIIGAVDCGSYEPENVRWILQPMTKPEYLRKMLYEYGMQITGEYAVEDSDKLYVVMVAEYNPDFRRLTEFEALYGFFAEGDELGNKYRQRESERLAKIAENLASAGKLGESVHYSALSEKMKSGADVYTVGEIYGCFDNVFPFETQEKWDNSGLLVNSGSDCSKVLLTLDIDKRAVDEAELKAVDMVISHHPVIFSPLKSISAEMPVYRLIKNDISAVCMHTNVDVSPFGTNGVILRELEKNFGFDGEPEHFNSDECGYVCTFRETVPLTDFAEILKKIFGCQCIRVSADAGAVKRAAFCSGSGGSFLAEAAASGCDAYITGDVKHDVWMDAQSLGVKLFDCGHFHTENPVIWEFRRILEEKFPRLDVEIAESSVDPCIYF